MDESETNVKKKVHVTSTNFFFSSVDYHTDDRTRKGTSYRSDKNDQNTKLKWHGKKRAPHMLFHDQ